MSFWDLLRPPAGAKANASPKHVTAAELRDALAQAEPVAAKAEEVAAAVAQERAALLLEADDKQLDAIERRLQLAQREADRGAAAVAALQERAAAAEERERQEGLDRLYAEAEAALRAGVEAYRVYGDLARHLRDHLVEIHRLQKQIERVRHDLKVAGDPRVPPDLDDVARPQTRSPRFAVSPLWAQACLPDPADPLALLYPIGTDTFRTVT